MGTFEKSNKCNQCDFAFTVAGNLVKLAILVNILIWVILELNQFSAEFNVSMNNQSISFMPTLTTKDMNNLDQ